MRNKLMLAALAAFIATPAMADDNNRFNGLSVGVDAGWQRNSATINAPGNVQVKDKDNGFAVRGRVGYDLQLADSFVIGVEAGAGNGGSTVERKTGAVQYSVNPGLTLDASARAGVVLGRNLLVYGRAGYGNSRIAVKASNSGSTQAAIDTSSRKGGFLWGAGAEYAFSSIASARVEYRRQNLGDLRSTSILGGVTLRF